MLKAFASFGFCKAHAAAFALPTYQSAWLKAHHPAAFLAGVLTHDPGMYPKRLILDDARQFGIAILPLDVNVSRCRLHASKGRRRTTSRRRRSSMTLATRARLDPRPARDGSAMASGCRSPTSKASTTQEIARIVAGRPYGSLSDFWHRAAVSRPIAERLVLAGGFDSLYGIGSTLPVKRRGRITRRDLLAASRRPRSLDEVCATAPVVPQSVRRWQRYSAAQRLTSRRDVRESARRRSRRPPLPCDRSTCSSRSTSATHPTRRRSAGCRR